MLTSDTTESPTRVRAPRRRRRSTKSSSEWRSQLKRLARPRYALMAGLLLTYVWRFQDLTPQTTQLRLAAICTVSSWAFLLVSPRAGVLGRAIRLPYVGLFLAFSAWSLITIPFALSPELAWTEWRLGHLKTITMVLFVLGCLTSLAVVRLAIAVHVFGAFALAYFYIKGGFPQWGSPVPAYDRNDLALALNVALPLALYLLFTAKTSVEKVVTGGAALALAVSIVMSQSRGGFLTIAITVVALLFIAKGIPVKVRVGIPALLAVSLFFLPAEVQDRLSTILEPTEDYNYTSETGRVAIWKRGMGYLGDHKISGVGWMNFAVAERTISETARRGTPGPGKVAHNSFLQAAVETGWVGFLLYLGILIGALARLFRLRSRLRRFRQTESGNELYLCSIFLILTLVSYCVGAQFLSRAYSPILFVPIVLVAGLELNVRSWLKQAGERVAPSRPYPRPTSFRRPGAVAAPHS